VVVNLAGSGVGADACLSTEILLTPRGQSKGRANVVPGC